jgi:processive 1,2-diacylglycerol beta-glucosyltransferase
MSYSNGHVGGPAQGRPRVLILSVSIGSGHVRAAEALELAFRRACPQAEVHNADVLALAAPLFRRCYGGLYLDFAANAPWILRYCYELMDRPRPCPRRGWWARCRVFLETLGLRRLLDLLHERPWDLIVNTHFLPGDIVADLKRRGQLPAKQVVVTTDYETTHAWINEPCELYVTATEEAALYLERQGVPAGRTRVLGIPIHPAFGAGKARGECLRRQGLAGDRPVLLQLAGGAGVGRIEAVYRALLEVEVPLDLVVVAGRNEAAARRLREIPSPRHRVKILGYTAEIDELMVAADLVVSKPGGLTTSEALACGTPLVVVDPLPGQEERNSDLLLESGAAIKANHFLTLAYKVTELLRDRARLDRMRVQARSLSRPRAAFDVVDCALGLLSPPSTVQQPPAGDVGTALPAGGQAARSG